MDPNLFHLDWERVGEVLATIVVLAFLLERALAVLFESRFFIKRFETTSVRNKTTTQSEKNKVYLMYGIPHPAHNTGSTQACEIDHLVSLELGGADTIPNLWPECSPGYANWQGPGFRDKDGFEKSSVVPCLY